MVFWSHHANAIGADQAPINTIDRVNDLLFEFCPFFTFFAESGRQDDKSACILFLRQYLNRFGDVFRRDGYDRQVDVR